MLKTYTTILDIGIDAAAGKVPLFIDYHFTPGYPPTELDPGEPARVEFEGARIMVNGIEEGAAYLFPMLPVGFWDTVEQEIIESLSE